VTVRLPHTVAAPCSGGSPSTWRGAAPCGWSDERAGGTGVLLTAVAGVGPAAGRRPGRGRLLPARRVEAVAAADAAALAAAPVTFLPFGAAGTPAEEAARFATANGARLVSCACALDPSWKPRAVTVQVAREASLWPAGSVTVTATGRAEFLPALLLNGRVRAGRRTGSSFGQNGRRRPSERRRPGRGQCSRRARDQVQRQAVEDPKLARPVYLVTAGQSPFDRAFPDRRHRGVVHRGFTEAADADRQDAGRAEALQSTRPTTGTSPTTSATSCWARRSSTTAWASTRWATSASRPAGPPALDSVGGGQGGGLGLLRLRPRLGLGADG